MTYPNDNRDGNRDNNRDGNHNNTSSTLDAFIEKVETNKPGNPADTANYNKEWAEIKATLPADQKEAAETKVRAVLVA